MTGELHFGVGERPRVEFRIQVGRIDCSAGAPGMVSLDIRGRGSEDVQVEQQGDTILVREERSGWLRTGSVRITAAVPVGTDIEMAGASTELFVDGKVGALRVKTASGDVTFEGAGQLDVKTASGDVRGGHVEGDVVISSASGDAYLEVVEGDLSANLASGDVDVRFVRGGLRAQTASGDVRVERCEGSEVSLKSVSGDLLLGLPTGIRLEANITSLSGEIHLPESRTESMVGGDRRRVKMDAKTVSGDIRIETYS